MRTLWLVMVAPLVVACSDACEDAGLDPEPWRLGEDASGRAPDVGGVSDTRPDPPDVPDIAEPLPDCLVWNTELVDAGFVQSVRGPVIVDRRVFVSNRQADASTTDLLEFADGTTVSWTGENATDELVVDGDGRWLWLGSSGHLARFDLTTNTMESVTTAAPAPAFGGDAYAQPRKQADGDRFGWIERGTVFVFDGNGTAQVGANALGAPWLDNGRVAWFGSEPEWFVSVLDVNGRTLTIDGGEAAVTWPVLADDHVFHLADGSVRAVSLIGGVEEAVRIDGVCGPLHTDGTTLVTACNPARTEPSPYWGEYLELGATELWEIDARTREVRAVHTTEEKTIYAPVVNERWIAWVEYEGAPGTFPEREGTVMVLPRGGITPSVVGRIGQGCPYCGAYWPPPRLVLRGNTLAWTYAIADDAPDGEPHEHNAVGIADLSGC